MPDLKVPLAVANVFYDLRDRRLLPLIALIVVAIVAVPFLLAGSESHPSRPAVSAAEAPAPAATAARSSQFAVTQVDPGLRVPRKRLAKRRAKDPFVQKFTHPVINQEAPTPQSATTSTTGTESSTTSTSAGSVESSPPASVPASPPPSSSSGGSGSGAVVTYTWAIDVEITKAETKPDGSREQDEPETKERILPPASLPAKKEQVVTYIGVNPTTEKPLFLVSTDVTSVFGEAKCVAGTGTCQLLEMERGSPETFVHGEHGVRYKINVVAVKPVPVAHS